MQKPLVKVLVGVAGLVLVVVGILKVVQGVNEIAGAIDPAARKASELTGQANAAVEEGRKLAADAGPKYQKLLEDVDGLGLAEVRAQQKADIEAIATAFGLSGERFREAGRAFREASTLKAGEMARYLSLLAQANEKYAEAKDGVKQITQLVLDESITDTDTLVARFEPIVAAITAANKAGDELAAEATKLTADHPDVFGATK